MVGTLATAHNFEAENGESRQNRRPPVLNPQFLNWNCSTDVMATGDFLGPIDMSLVCAPLK